MKKIIVVSLIVFCLLLSNIALAEEVAEESSCTGFWGKVSCVLFGDPVKKDQAKQALAGQAGRMRDVQTRDSAPEVEELEDVKEVPDAKIITLPEKEEIKCVDTDGGRNFEVKGRIKGADPKNPDQEMNEEDRCSSDTRIIEFECKDDSLITWNGYDCPNDGVCRDGACVEREVEILPATNEEEKEMLPATNDEESVREVEEKVVVEEKKVICRDTDGGYNVDKKGTITGLNIDNNEVTYTDFCRTSQSETRLDSCSGARCRIKEWGCTNNIVGSNVLSCKYGCGDGACLAASRSTGSAVEEPVVEPIEEKTLDCTDSDRGQNIYLKGETFKPGEGTLKNTKGLYFVDTARGRTWSDACQLKTETGYSSIDEGRCSAGVDCYVIEFSCNADSIRKACPNGCVDGACLKTSRTVVVEKEAEEVETVFEAKETRCADGKDNDNDNKIDCFDADCSPAAGEIYQAGDDCTLTNDVPTCCLYHSRKAGTFVESFDTESMCLGAGRFPVINERVCERMLEQKGYVYIEDEELELEVVEVEVSETSGSNYEKYKEVLSSCEREGNIFDHVTDTCLESCPRGTKRVAWGPGKALFSCLPEESPGCTDTDEVEREYQKYFHVNYEVKGTTTGINVKTGEFGSTTDFCSDENTIREFFCSYHGPDKYLTSTGHGHTCPNGGVCEDGACLPGTEVEDSDLPPGLEELPPGLAKKDKTPPGWEKGEKSGWEEVTEVTEEAAEPYADDCNGCESNGKCLPFGTRKVVDEVASFCDLEGRWASQASLSASCQNDYECQTNECSNGQCEDLAKKLEETENALNKLLDFVKKFFGVEEETFVIEEDFGIIEYGATKEDSTGDFKMLNNPSVGYEGYYNNLYVLVQDHEKDINEKVFIGQLLEDLDELELQDMNEFGQHFYCTDDNYDQYVCTWFSGDIFVALIINNFEEFIDLEGMEQSFEDMLLAYLEKFPSSITLNIEDFSDVEKEEIMPEVEVEEEEEVMSLLNAIKYRLFEGDKAKIGYLLHFYNEIGVVAAFGINKVIDEETLEVELSGKDYGDSFKTVNVGDVVELVTDDESETYSIYVDTISSYNPGNAVVDVAINSDSGVVKNRLFVDDQKKIGYHLQFYDQSAAVAAFGANNILDAETLEIELSGKEYDDKIMDVEMGDTVELMTSNENENYFLSIERFGDNIVDLAIRKETIE